MLPVSDECLLSVYYVSAECSIWGYDIKESTPAAVGQESKQMAPAEFKAERCMPEWCSTPGSGE